MTRNLSYYIRRKLNNRFTQGEFFEPRDFVKFLEKHDIRIREEQLERFEKEGWLLPAFRINLTEELQKSGLMLGNEGIKSFYKDGLVEFPKKGDYQPWDNFKHDWKKGEMHDKKLIYYHSFQLLQIQNILRSKKFSFMYYDSHTDESLQKVLSNIKRSREWYERSFHKDLLSSTKTIGLFMLLEEPYRYQSFGHFSTPIFRKSDGFESWVKWRREKYDAQKLLKDSGLTVDEVRKIYDRFATQGHLHDPLEKWYDLTRIMRISVLEKLKGAPLTAQFYYSIARMLAHFLYDLNKEIMYEPDTIFDGRRGEWKKNIYSDPFDYVTRKTQRGIIRYFVRDITTRLYLLVEGETEEKVVRKIFENLDIDTDDDSITIFNYGGVQHLRSKNIKSIIETANKDKISIFIIADNEGNAKHKIESMKKLVLSEFEYHIWNKDFESDNFGRDRLLKLVNFHLKKHNQKILSREVSTKQKQGIALIHAIELAYGSKYHSDIYKKIPKKSDLSLELMQPRLKMISRKKKTGKPLPIENVLEQVFRMVPYWG